MLMNAITDSFKPPYKLELTCSAILLMQFYYLYDSIWMCQNSSLSTVTRL